MAAAREAVERLDGLLSRTDSDSQIARLNTAAGDGAAVAVDPDVAELLAFSQEIARQLPGDFDITIAPVMDAWGFTTEERARTRAGCAGRPPWPWWTARSSPWTRKPLPPHWPVLAWRWIWAPWPRALRPGRPRRPSGMPGGTSRHAGSGRQRHGHRRQGGRLPWRVAVKDPRDTGSYLCVLALTDVTLSTSGGYERYFEEDGVRYHHIIDPETGYPADSGLLSVTVVSADHLLADALSTALFVAGPEEALDFWRSRDDFELVLCTGQGELLVTEGLEDVFTFAGADRGYTYEIARR